MTTGPWSGFFSGQQTSLKKGQVENSPYRQESVSKALPEYMHFILQ
jgi:hypothetical protein